MLHLYNLSIINKRLSPIYSAKHILLSGIAASIVVFLLLFFFQPFRIYEHSFLWRLFLSFIYSTIPFLLYLLFYLLYRRRIRKGLFYWSLREEFFYFFINSFIGGFLVYGYSYLIMNVLFPYEFLMPKNFLLKSIYYSLLFGLIIYFFTKTYSFLTYFYVTTNNDSFKIESNSGKTLLFNSNNDVYKFNCSDIILIQSSLNDTVIYHTNNKKILTTLLKNTSLKQIEEKYPFPQYSLIRCHKSFLVNFNHILFTRGNSKTTILKLKGGFVVPVSRNKIKFLKDLLQK